MTQDKRTGDDLVPVYDRPCSESALIDHGRRGLPKWGEYTTTRSGLIVLKVGVDSIQSVWTHFIIKREICWGCVKNEAVSTSERKGRQPQAPVLTSVAQYLCFFCLL